MTTKPSDKVQPADFQLAFQVFREISIISQLSTALITNKLPLGIKESQFHVLTHFVTLDCSSTPAKLANAFQVTKGAMTNTINRLLTLELVKIEEDTHDRRVKHVSITEKGKKIQKEAVLVAYKELEPMLQNFTTEKFSNALPFLTDIRNYLDENRN